MRYLICLYKDNIRNKGFTLISVLIAVGVMGIVILGTSSMIRLIYFEKTILSKKLEALGLKNNLIKIFADGSLCTEILTSGGVAKTFSLTNPTIDLDHIPSSAALGAPFIIESNKNFSKDLKIGLIQVSNIKQLGVTDEYSAFIVVNFNDSKTVLAPIVLPVLLYTRPVNGLKEVINCHNSSIVRIERFYFKYGNSPKSGNTYYCNPTCTWTAPKGIKGAGSVSIAGGGASATGAKVVTGAGGGNSGGFLMNYPVNLQPGEKIQITIGRGGAFKQDPSMIVGEGGKESRFGNYVSCSGGGMPKACYYFSAKKTSLWRSYKSPGLIQGVDLEHRCDGVGVLMEPASFGEGLYGGSGPGSCGPGLLGQGFKGSQFWGLQSGRRLGGRTPFVFGSGGDVTLSGAALTSTGHRMDPVAGVFPANTVWGKWIFPENGKSGVVIVDVLK